jgi:hypothetical protein
MVYVVIIIVVVVGGSGVLGIHHVRHENAPGIRPSLRDARRVVRRSRILASGGQCMCGGTLADAGEASSKFGALMSCPDCGRSWTTDGRSIVRRRRVPRRDP